MAHMNLGMTLSAGFFLVSDSWSCSIARLGDSGHIQADLEIMTFVETKRIELLREQWTFPETKEDSK